MTEGSRTLLLGCAVGLALLSPGSGGRARAAGREGGAPMCVRDVLWAWGNPEMTVEGEHTRASYSQASPAQRAGLLGVRNLVMAGHGLPEDDREADWLTREVSGLGRLVWEIGPDGGAGPPFVYEKRMAQVRRLAGRYPQIEGVLLDDMSTVAVREGLTPQEVGRARELLHAECPSVKLWGVVYTMSLGDEGLADYVRQLEGISLWTWHARDIGRMEANVAQCEAMFPDKPLLLGLYLYDYGEGRRMPQALLEEQCATARRLAGEGRVQGIVLLTITDDAEAVGWAADWIAQVGDQSLTAAGGGPVDPDLRIGNGEGWSFHGGAWMEDAEGVIRPPDQPNLHSRAFHTSEALSDVIVNFEYYPTYRETGSGMAGVILRASDPDHFTLVYFPWGGQQLRAKHFWAAVAKVEGDGYLRNLGAAWVPGVPSETDRWYGVRLEARGSEIAVWVDGRRALTVSDPDPTAGCLGLAGYGWYAFRNVRYAGEASSPPAWESGRAIPRHSFTVGLTSQEMPSGCVAPNGDVLLAAGGLMVRSTDQGRTWSAPAALPETLGPVSDYGSTMFRTAGGRLVLMVCRTQEQAGGPLPQIALAESLDSGATWSDPAPCAVADGWPTQPRNLVPYGPLVETEDGTLLRFLLGGVKEEGDTFTNVVTWGATHCKAFVIRSTDGGRSWSAPVEIDQPAWSGTPRGAIPGSLDLTEPTGVAIGNAVTVLVRPVYSPTMWQCWSRDSGATWDAAARTTFPGYAQSMVRTRSGAILCAHRYPLYSVNVSRDGGLNWDEGTVIDYPVWGMGCLVEVEPDVVLCTYMNAQREQPLLAQLVRVTEDRLAPG